MISKFELEEELTIQYTTYFRQFGKLFWLESQNTQSKTLHFTILVYLVVIVYPEVVAEQRIGLCVASLCLSHYGCRSQSKALSGFQFDLNFNEVNTVDTQSNKTVLLLQMIYTASSVYDDGIYTRATVTGDYSFFTQFHSAFLIPFIEFSQESAKIIQVGHAKTRLHLSNRKIVNSFQIHDNRSSPVPKMIKFPPIGECSKQLLVDTE